ncbi:MAG TPA: hypothetical protein VJT75_04590 [Thermoleophilaceae bacterium]|nr:hypothetical protein [Thermoleophilaceae bacterium]
MATRAQQDPGVASVLARRQDERARKGQGYVTFAVTMLIVVGILNCIGGIAAANESEFFAGKAGFMVGDLQSLGWAVLLLGIVQILCGVGVRARSFAAVWVAVICTGGNLLVQMLLVQAQPLWSIAIAVVDVVILHALIAYAEPATDT